ncbi:class I SAM-dependent methyltransferase [Nostoc sp. 'Peltigera membranacea cyanobiont' 232]|uniref:class I SAM-dependent methyltransferase n=1 Tax=Nostoc sp. 'Peltigera membranacea cyanobiont' 232 TaxID=2014531 RepID=UPI000B9586D1|nr:class I SAM-dependent methyltransferase [Nostoc sp. 'Peltigera membranacea cyanobiont' 232]OYE02382.1 hypothetical protein CDG79_24255 [Nostoc sp. 'Peltigera membranacea cyanobiont' 232]
MSTNYYDASEAWKQELDHEGYEHHCYSAEDLRKIKRLGRVWQKILQITQLTSPDRLFELGCGGGIHLSKLALNGFEVHGIDVSNGVVARAQNYLEEVSKFQPIKASVEVANIFDYQSSESYDMCFHVGVIEHFLELSQRQQIWDKLYSLTKPGGWIVSVVPCGKHFMRKMIRDKGIGGYNIPEIDYSCASHRKEFEHIGLTSIHTLSHNYFSFLAAHPSRLISQILYPLLFIGGNILMPHIPLSESVKERCAASLIVIGKKIL